VEGFCGLVDQGELFVARRAFPTPHSRAGRDARPYGLVRAVDSGEGRILLCWNVGAAG
jgi:hypothetical protein